MSDDTLEQSMTDAGIGEGVRCAACGTSEFRSWPYRCDGCGLLLCFTCSGKHIDRWIWTRVGNCHTARPTRPERGTVPVAWPGLPASEQRGQVVYDDEGRAVDYLPPAEADE